MDWIGILFFCGAGILFAMAFWFYGTQADKSRNRIQAKLDKLIDMQVMRSYWRTKMSDFLWLISAKADQIVSRGSDDPKHADMKRATDLAMGAVLFDKLEAIEAKLDKVSKLLEDKDAKS